jgi:hypothetical protein
MEKPMTKATVWMKTARLLVSADRETAPPIFAMYIGTKGSTQGEINAAIPAPKAIGKDTSVITCNHKLLAQSKSDTLSVTGAP